MNNEKKIAIGAGAALLGAIGTYIGFRHMQRKPAPTPASSPSPAPPLSAAQAAAVGNAFAASIAARRKSP